MDEPERMAERYRKAAAELPTSAAMTTAGSAVDGFWLDADRYFFVSEADVDGVGPVPVPFIASRASAAARPVVEPARLVSVLRDPFPDLRPDQLRVAKHGLDPSGLLTVELKGRVLTIDPSGPAVLGAEPTPARAELLSPSGRLALFVDGHDLAVQDRTDGAVRRLTTDGEVDWPYGQQAQASLSTLAYRRRPHPIALWSPDESWILTHRIDERHLPERALIESAPPGGGAPVPHGFRYASARDPLPLVTPLAIHLPSGRRVSLATEELTLFPPLVSRWIWFVDNDRVCRLRSDRHQRRLWLELVDLSTGAARMLFEEHAEDGYLEPHPVLGQAPNIRYLPETEELVWWSERDGWGHLYLIDAATGLIRRQLTRGEWPVRDIVDIDAASRTLLFTAGGHAEEDPVLRSLMRVSLDGDAPELVLRGDQTDGEAAIRPELQAGTERDRLRASGLRISVSPDQGAVVVRRSAPAGATRTEILDLAERRAFPIVHGRYIGVPPRPMWLDVVAADGTKGLKAALFLPRDHDGEERLPILDLVYPGPQSLFLARTAGGRVAQQAQALAELGLAVLVTDSRGTPFRSRFVHQQGFGDLLEPQMRDHVAILGQLSARLAFLDSTRVGILGSSAGGAAAVHAMLVYPDVYHVGVALCGPYDPADYLCGWVLKYVGPDVDGRWEAQRLSRLAANLRGRLLLMHGELDDNVHPSQTMRLAAALIAARKPFDMILLPGEGHMVQLTSAYAQQAIWDYLVTHLRGRKPPEGFVLDYGASDLAVLGGVNGREAPWL